MTSVVLRQVSWEYVGSHVEDAEIFHIDLYNCGADEDCAGDCGEFSAPLCEEQGCFTTNGSETISLPEVLKIEILEVNASGDSVIGRYLGIAGLVDVFAVSLEWLYYSSAGPPTLTLSCA